MSLPWVRLDVRIPLSPEMGNLRTERGGDRAAFVFLACLMWTKEFEQGGYINPGIAKMHRCTPRIADLLVKHRLWFPAGLENGWISLWAEDPKPATRPHIANAIRRAVFERDEHACVICGSGDRLTLDHIEHWSAGGADTIDNLRTLCHSCNSSRGAKTDLEWLGTGP